MARVTCASSAKFRTGLHLCGAPAREPVPPNRGRAPACMSQGFTRVRVPRSTTTVGLSDLDEVAPGFLIIQHRGPSRRPRSRA